MDFQSHQRIVAFLINTNIGIIATFSMWLNDIIWTRNTIYLSSLLRQTLLQAMLLEKICGRARTPATFGPAQNMCLCSRIRMDMGSHCQSNISTGDQLLLWGLVLWNPTILSRALRTTQRSSHRGRAKNCFGGLVGASRDVQNGQSNGRLYQ